jgi:predicted nucleotidyltransferase
MEPGEICELVRRTASDLVGIGGLERAILFGSAARGEMTEASDLDIVLIFDTLQSARFGAIEAQRRRTKPLWPTDYISIDKATFAEKSLVGGVFYCAREEGRDILEKNHDAHLENI